MDKNMLTFLDMVREAHLKRTHEALKGEALAEQALYIAARWLVEQNTPSVRDQAQLLITGIAPLTLADFVEDVLSDRDEEETVEEVLAGIVNDVYN
jgi:hypothetical protein